MTALPEALFRIRRVKENRPGSTGGGATLMQSLEANQCEQARRMGHRYVRCGGITLVQRS